MDNDVMVLARRVSSLTSSKLNRVRRVADKTKMLAINARIEASRAGDSGRSFAVVADEVKSVSESVTELADELEHELADQLRQLDAVGLEVQGSRLADLALNMIDIVDRNLYERSCDVRWWATDSAVHELCSDPSPARVTHAAERLGVILDSYTVYLDLWVADTHGVVLTNARSDTYTSVRGSRVAEAGWFRDALATPSGEHYAVADVTVEPRLGHAQVATYATAIRDGGRVDGKIVGVLGIFFDWQPQAHAVVTGVRLSDEERSCTRCLLLDRSGRVLASSDGQGLLEEHVIGIGQSKEAQGYFKDRAGQLWAYARTPGYETYEGLGWYGAISQR